jgi:hypothetical protein
VDDDDEEEGTGMRKWNKDEDREERDEQSCREAQDRVQSKRLR